MVPEHAQVGVFTQASQIYELPHSAYALPEGITAPSDARMHGHSGLTEEQLISEPPADPPHVHTLVPLHDVCQLSYVTVPAEQVPAVDQHAPLTGVAQPCVLQAWLTIGFGFVQYASATICQSFL